jgi:3-deoxy-manno-octulosonate cytidylyltransferase (CMP-KDO synthetase)
MKGTGHTVAIIPARFASSRLPGKPLVDICGKPMIQHVVERTRQARHVDDVIVATDDHRIVDAVHAFGGRAVMTPPELPSGSDRIAFVARTMPDVEHIVNVQGDEPLIVPAMIDEALEPLLADRTIMAGTLVRKIESPEELLSPSVVKAVLDRNGYCLYFSRAAIPFVRDMPVADWPGLGVHYKHIGLYVYSKDFLMRYTELPAMKLESLEKLEQLRILEAGYRIKAVVTTHTSLSVDTADDLERVRKTMRGIL